MESLLIVLGTVLVLWVLVMVTGFLLLRRGLRRRNRVVPHSASPAPVSWLASPGAPARLHRRLRASVAVATATPSELTGVADVRADLTRRALELDRSLATAGRAKGPRRRQLLREVAAEIDDIDALAHRIDRLVSRRDQLLAPPDGQPELDRLAEQLTAYEDAADELAEIERQVQGELGT
ncbi:MAG TPA: hypothetical protein VMW08_18735 [Acidimicrobiales bacterium]|nr:hypothetical protein [Acidimicrobiales bacterium]